jgi:hypothetical protein
MISRRSNVLVVLAITAAIALSACATPATPDAGSPSAPPTPQTSEPTPASSPTPVIVPSDCRGLVAPEVYDVIFGDLPLNDPSIAEVYPVGVLTPTAAEADATPAEAVESATELRCVWRDPAADVTYLQIEVAQVAPAVSEAYLGALPGLRYTCDDALGGLRCQLVGISPLYPVEEATTVFVRDDIVISVEQANVPTTNLLGEVVGGIWTS